MNKDIKKSTRFLASREDLIKGLSDVENRSAQKIYWTSLIQILTIIGSIIAMFKRYLYD